MVCRIFLILCWYTTQIFLLLDHCGPYQLSRASIPMDSGSLSARWLYRQLHGSCPSILCAPWCVFNAVSAPQHLLAYSKCIALFLCICKSNSCLSQTWNIPITFSQKFSSNCFQNKHNTVFLQKQGVFLDHPSKPYEISFFLYLQSTLYSLPLNKHDIVLGWSACSSSQPNCTLLKSRNQSCLNTYV